MIKEDDYQSIKYYAAQHNLYDIIIKGKIGKINPTGWITIRNDINDYFVLKINKDNIDELELNDVITCRGFVNNRSNDFVYMIVNNINYCNQEGL